VTSLSVWAVDDYALTNLRTAVENLVGRGSLQQRLYWALLPLTGLSDAFSDAEERDRYSRILAALRDRHDAEAEHLTISDDDGAAIARGVLNLYEDVLRGQTRSETLVEALGDRQEKPHED
jgi:hypothetical protein